MEAKKIDRDEKEYVFSKTMTCPVCDKKFITKQVKTGKGRFIGTDDDLRPRYDGIDGIKYDTIMCPHCGYAALLRVFTQITPKQIKEVKTQIGDKYNSSDEDYETYSYEIAIRRCKMAMLSAMVIHGKLSESSYLCLKLAWLYRGAAEELESLEDAEAQSEKIASMRKSEDEYLHEAYKGFSEALLKEYPPICNMDEMTLNYLMSSLAVKCKDYEAAQKYAYLIIGSRSATSKLKEKARVLVEEIKEEKAEEKAE